MRSQNLSTRHVLFASLALAVALSGFQGPVTCASTLAAAAAKHEAAPRKCVCGGKGKCCLKGCCVAKRGKPADNQSGAPAKAQRSDLAVMAIHDLLVGESSPRSFPKPSSLESAAPFQLCTLITEHTCLQV
jgi:hypothetical protein